MALSSLSAELWRENQDLALACRQHAFVSGLEDGSLDTEAFRRYVAQDAFFLRSFLSAYALAAARCAGEPARVRVFLDLMAGVLEELELHEGYSESLGIDLAEVQPFAATSAYTDFLKSTAWSGELAEIVAAMTPCMRLYAYLGRELEPEGLRDDNPYRDWIATYSSDEMESLAGALERLLDGVGTGSAEERKAYRYAMRCELDFFAAPLVAPGPVFPDS